VCDVLKELRLIINICYGMLHCSLSLSYEIVFHSFCLLCWMFWRLHVFVWVICLGCSVMHISFLQYERLSASLTFSEYSPELALWNYTDMANFAASPGSGFSGNSNSLPFGAAQTLSSIVSQPSRGNNKSHHSTSLIPGKFLFYNK